MAAVTARTRMACDEVEPLLSPLVDGELLEEDRLGVREHLDDCSDCRRRFTALERTKSTLALVGGQVDLPDEVATRIRDSIGREAHHQARRRGARRLGAGAAIGLVAAAAALFVMQRAPAATNKPRDAVAPVVGELAARHELELPIDVASPDPRRVQEFLAARVGRSLRVPQLERLGWGLQGARVVDLDQRRGAHIVYRGGYGQRLSLVVLPDPDGHLRARVLPQDSLGEASALEAVAENGLHVRMIARDGSLYSFVSDVGSDGLQRLSGELDR